MTPERCATCSDEAVAGRVVALADDEATVELPAGERAQVAIDLVPGVEPGDLLLCHAGIALALLPAEDDA